MGKWLSAEWIEDTIRLGRNMPQRDGASAKINYVVIDGPDGDSTYYWIVENGQLMDAGLGELGDADVTLSNTYSDARDIQQGVLDANTAFMQGKIKVTGDMMKLLELLPITSSPEYKTLEEDLAALTEF